MPTPTLSAEKHQLAVNFLAAQPRALAHRRYHGHIAGESPALVLHALSAYQNPDGGFGNALEPDIRLVDSSVIATTVALQHLRGMGATENEPHVKGACQYLLDTYHEDKQAWEIVPAHISDAPHAPWWTYDADITKCYANPRAEIVGYMLDYSNLFPDDMRQTLITAVTDYLLTHDDQMEMHDIQCYVRLLETENLPTQHKQEMLPKMHAILEHNVNTDPASWHAYGLPPLAVVSSPQSPFYNLFADAIPANLQHIINTQSENGSWGPAWSWEDVDAAAWEQAKSEWSAVLTANNLIMLHRFNALASAR